MDSGMTDEKFKEMIEHGRRSRMVMIMVAVYKNPHDFPHKYVGRVWFIGKGKHWASNDMYVVRDTIEEVRAAVPKWMTRLGRSEDEDPVVVETYM